MTAFLYTQNPAKWHWVDLQDAIYRVSNGLDYDLYWSCRNTNKVKIGDTFFLIRLGVEPKGIIGCGYVLSEPYERPHWDSEKAKQGQTTMGTDLLFKALSDQPIFSLERLKEKHPEFHWTPQTSGNSIPDAIADELLEQVQAEEKFSFEQPTKREVQLYAEGKPSEVTSRTYDRSVAARQACLDYHGYACSVCGFDFEQVYGQWGKSYIEVHHLRQVADIGEEYLIDPVVDLRPVCANCHRMLHKTRPPISVELLQTKLREGSNSGR